MIDASGAAAAFQRSIAAAPTQSVPFRHWLLNDVLPSDTIAALCRLPIAPPRITDTLGKRETNNATRMYVTPEARWNWPVARAIGDVFQAWSTAKLIGDRCAVDLSGAFLRIEYCQDTDGFWLEPHTDIRAKLSTLVIYLSQPPDGETWGTDLYDANRSEAGHAPCGPGKGLLFIPADDTWHGFRRRKITGVRRSLIVNYVKPEWRARQELAYPELPVGRGS